MNEAIGLVATILIIAGFLLDGETKIRSANIIGAGLYVIYGILIGSPSNILLNGILILVHIYKLNRMKRR